MDIQTINKLNQSNVMSLPFINKAMNGSSVQELPSRTFKECQDACLLNEKCLYANYDNGSRNCSLVGAQVRDGFNAYIKTANSYDMYENTYYQGLDLGEPLQVSEDVCKSLCSDNDKCRNYNYGNNTCYIMGFSDASNSTSSLKMIKKNTAIDDETIQNNMYCCMNYPVNVDCNELLPFSPKCDVFMKDLCTTNPDLEQCGCINRKKNFRYKGIKDKITQKLGGDILDECWYPACRSGSQAYIPTDMLPIGVDMYSAGEMNRIDNLKCVRSRVCDIDNLNDPDFLKKCRGLMGYNGPLIEENVEENVDVTEPVIVVPADAMEPSTQIEVTPEITPEIIEGFTDVNVGRIGDQLLVLIILIIIIALIINFSK